MSAPSDSDDEKVSAYPPGYVARVPSTMKDKLSAVLVARAMGYLRVRVTFHKEPCAGLKVKFSKAGDDGKPGDPIGDETKTDDDGRAEVPFMVPAGIYACEIENQQPTVVNTVHDWNVPFPVITPIDRPYFDVDEEHEWDVEEEEENAGTPDADDPEPEDDDSDADAGGGSSSG